MKKKKKWSVREWKGKKKLNGDKFDDAVFEEDYSDARDVKDF